MQRRAEHLARKASGGETSEELPAEPQETDAEPEETDAEPEETDATTA